MNIIQRIRFSISKEVSNLYIKGKYNLQLNSSYPNEKIILQKEDVISLNTYYNSFYEKYYTKYTSINSFYYMLKLKGDFKIIVYRDFINNERELLVSNVYKSCKGSDFIKMKLPNISKGIENCGRIFLEIICLSNTGEFFGGFIGTDQKKNREVSLGIITCTYKKDAFIKKTVDTILDDNDLLKKNIEIFVIDNGNTLRQNDFEDSRIKLIVNKNFGGSGGFNRGLIEAYSNDKITHFLLMDDDIELDSESIFRLFSLFEYAVMDIVVSGNMLDLLKKDILYESGAVYGIRPNNWKDPFAIAPLKYNLSLSQNDSLNLLLNEEHIDYGGFWFFALTRKIVATTGLLMPFFIKVDDMEFGLRINKYFSDIIIAFPSIGVWHEPFYAKRPMWDYYYYIRNFLITNSIYNIFSYFKTICAAILNIFQNILYAEIFLRAFLDFMKGPKNIKNINSETTHREIIILSGKYIKIRNKKKLIRIIYKLFNLLFIFQWLIVAIYSFPKWKSTRQQWKEASRELTSFNFWNSYLGIDKSSHKKT